MRRYHDYLLTYVNAVLTSNSKHRQQRRPISRATWLKREQLLRSRRATAKASRRRNRR